MAVVDQPVDRVDGLSVVAGGLECGDQVLEVVGGAGEADDEFVVCFAALDAYPVFGYAGWQVGFAQSGGAFADGGGVACGGAQLRGVFPAFGGVGDPACGALDEF